jgi:hypothetical protein
MLLSVLESSIVAKVRGPLNHNHKKRRKGGSSA